MKKPICVLYVREEYGTGHTYDWKYMESLSDEMLKTLIMTIKNVLWEAEMYEKSVTNRDSQGEY